MMNPWRGLRGLPREAWILFATVLINRAGMMALPFLVLYLTERLAMSPSRAGLVLGVYGAGSLLTAPLAGRLVDRIGPLPVMRASLLLSGVVLWLFPLATGYAMVLALTVVWAVISEAFRPASMAVTADVVEPERRKAAFALMRLAINLGMSVGPLAGGFLATVSFTALFFVDGTTSILAGAVLLFSRWRVGHHHAAEDGETISRRSAFADRRFLYFLGALTLVTMVFFQHQGALPLFIVRELGYKESIYGMLFAVNTVLIVLIEVPLNTAMAHWTHRSTLALGALLTGIGFGALGFVSSIWGIILSVVVWTFGEMILLPSSAAYVADIAPQRQRGAYMGVYQMLFGLVLSTGPWLGTAVMERYGSPVLWGASFLVGCVSALMLSRVRE